MTLSAAPLERPDSLKDLAFRRIKALLTEGRLEPDRIYSANQFADTLAVSRTPVREALLQLATEGFLVFVEGRGFRIRRYTAKEVQDFFETRRLIETYVAEKLTGKLGPEELAALDGQLRAMRGFAAERDAARFLEADQEFHLSLVRRHSNLHLASLMEGIRSHIAIFGLKAIAHEGRFREVVQEHGAIVSALREAQPRKVVRAVLLHLHTTERYVLGEVRRADAGKEASP
jgi:DNA-binding GntR family transcriptional regulator